MCVPEGRPRRRQTRSRASGPEIKGRAGKGVTTISGLPMSLTDIESLATKLKKRCGSGGTVREGVIEIQGDHRDVIVAELVKLGWPAKKSGGIAAVSTAWCLSPAWREPSLNHPLQHRQRHRARRQYDVVELADIELRPPASAAPFARSSRIFICPTL